MLQKKSAEHGERDAQELEEEEAQAGAWSKTLRKPKRK